MAIVDIFAEVEKIKKDLHNLSVEELKDELAANEDLLLIDIREIQELVDLGTIPGAVHVARGMMEFWASPTSPYYRDFFTEEKRIVVFCAGGGRSAFAARDLIAMGFNNVAHLELGFNGWAKQGGSVEDFASTSRWVRREKPES
jgi:rhodanese-related sulfurtransferase